MKIESCGKVSDACPAGAGRVDSWTGSGGGFFQLGLLGWGVPLIEWKALAHAGKVGVDADPERGNGARRRHCGDPHDAMHARCRFVRDFDFPDGRDETCFRPWPRAYFSDGTARF